MTLIDYGNGSPAIAGDAWTHVADGAVLPPDRPATISLERWKAGRDGLTGRNLPLGIRLESHERIEEILPDLPRFALIALDFPNLNDGRHFTTARLLRERYGFRGQLRATGQVLRDQIDLMKRCGFDAFELPAGKDAASAIAAFGEISVAYQPAADAHPTAAQLRHRQPVQAMAS
ncbi:MAG: DUF934 domain-containing protein [Alphaproteobacteria bacterium]|nr:DUF934 domain-containing protein [Alphaproteobacteria bacterium]MCK5621679.1 DUF934 domain-containing protein [Alphaproteobacteria bacterium]